MTKKLTGKGGPGRGQGHKPMYPEQGAMVTVTLKMTIPLRDKLKTLGGAQWVRDQVAKAKSDT